MSTPDENPPTGDADLDDAKKGLKRDREDSTDGEGMTQEGHKRVSVDVNSSSSAGAQAQQAQESEEEAPPTADAPATSSTEKPADATAAEGGDASGDPEKLTEYVEVPNEHVGRVIGKSGASIRVLQNLSGAHIDIPGECEPGTTYRKVSVTGTPKEIAYCRQLIMQKCDPEAQDSTLPLPEDGKVITKRIEVPDDSVGKIIGKGGATIRQLQDLSRAHVDVAKASENTPEGMRPITLTGTPEQIATCEKYINMKLEGQNLPDAAGSAPNVPGSMPLITQTEMKVLIPKEFVGKVIGKGGATIRELQDFSGAHMDIAKENQPGTELREISLRGNAAQMAYCNLLIQGKITNNDHSNPSYSQAYQAYIHIYQQTTQMAVQPPGANQYGGGNAAAYGQVPYGQQSQAYGAPAAAVPQQPQQYTPYGQQPQQVYGGQAGQPGMYGQAAAYGQQPGAAFGQQPQAFGGGGDKQTTIIQVPNEHVGRVIGKGGASIKEIQQQSGAHVDIPGDTGSATRDLSITGDMQQIKICAALIQQKLATAAVPR